MEFLHRRSIDAIPAYRQGKPAPSVPGKRSFKLSSNENPYSPLPSVLAALDERALPRINRYPDMRGWQVVQRLAELHDVEPSNIMLGCGSTEVITQLVHVVAGVGDEVIYPWRSFEAYPIIVAGAGAVARPIANRAHGEHDIDAMIAALNERTRLVIVNNPNNPTSASLSADEALRLMHAVPSDVLVLFDEAYCQFNTAPNTSKAMDIFGEFPNIVVARTFSKAYGLAGLRIGYAVAQAEVVEAMGKVALPFGVSDMAQVAALASLEAPSELETRVNQLIAERERVVAALHEQGWHVDEPYANFFWLPLGEHTEQGVAVLRAAGISPRAFDGEGIRISLGEPEANDAIIAACNTLKQELGEAI